jgi:tetratricopeptide (TPR) repeat protein
MHKMAANNLKMLVLVLGLVHTLDAAAGYAIRSNEVMLLPPSCFRMTSGNFEPDAYKIVKTQRKGPSLGPAMQHFCHGMKSVIRANNGLGTKDEHANLQAAIGEFNYVLEAVAAKNKNGRFNTYLAITSIEKAKVLQRLKMTADAVQTYEQAIKYNPKLPQAYSGLSDIYRDQGKNDEARKTLELGLKRAPNSKGLQRRLKDI